MNLFTKQKQTPRHRKQTYGLLLFLFPKQCLTLFDCMDCGPPGFSLSMRFPRQEYWSGLPFPSPGDLPTSGIEPTSPALAGGFFTSELPGKPKLMATNGEIGWGGWGINQELGINRYTLLLIYMKYINNKCYTIQHCIQYLGISYNGKESEKEQTYPQITESFCCTSETC